MPTWLKIILAICAVGIAAMIGVGFVAYNWAMKNRDTFEKVPKQGQEYGKGKTFEQCADAAVEQLGSNAFDLTKRMQAQMFITGCLSTAEKSPELCATAPQPSEILKLGQWTADQCRKRNSNNPQGCAQMYQIVAASCHR